MKTLFALLSLALVLGSCRTAKNSTDEVTSISHGTSFGHCVGYCVKEEIYTKDKIAFRQSSRQENYPEKTSDAIHLADYDFDKLAAELDRKAFMSLPETIGCPDCADGGAEYIEVTTASGTKRVTFEAGKSPEGMEKLLELLRANKQRMDN